MKIKMTIELPVRIVKKEKWFVASCHALDVFSQGDTREQAKSNLEEALLAFLTSCMERGVLEAVLKECGFTPIPLDSDLAHDDVEEEKIDIPLYLLAKYSESSQCHRA